MQREEKEESTMERFTRPSCLAMLNTNVLRDEWLEENNIPPRLNDTPERTIINFFSGLQNLNGTDKSKFIAFSYGFLAPSLQRKISTEEMEDRLNGINGVHLIKIIRLAKDRNQLFATRFFIELEILEESYNEIRGTSFSYLYGFIDVIQEQNVYRISQYEFEGEKFQPRYDYEWNYNGESYVDIHYGCHCNLVENRYPTRKDGYVKNIFVKGIDQKDYLFRFVELTNGVDFEIQSFQKDAAGQWIPTKIQLSPTSLKENDSEEEKQNK